MQVGNQCHLHLVMPKEKIAQTEAVSAAFLHDLQVETMLPAPHDAGREVAQTKAMSAALLPDSDRGTGQTRPLA